MKNPHELLGGIYLITCTANGKVYVGSTGNFAKRWAVHRCHLRAGKHSNRHLNFAWKKYGESSFVFSVLEQVEDPDKLTEREQHYIDALNACDCGKGFNLRSIAASNLGYRYSDEQRSRLSEALRGREISEEHRRLLSLASKGKPKGEAHKAKCRIAGIGYRHTQEARASMSKTRTGKAIPAQRKLTRTQEMEVIRLHSTGHTMRSLAAEFGCALMTISRAIHGRRLPLDVCA